MPTLREIIEEGRARKARLDEAEAGNWGDAIPDCRDTVSEWDYVMQQMLEGNMERLLAVAGDLHLGELPIGQCMAYSKPYDWVDEVPQDAVHEAAAPKP